MDVIRQDSLEFIHRNTTTIYFNNGDAIELAPALDCLKARMLTIEFGI